MSRCSKVGLVVAVLFALANVGGGAVAAAQEEGLHAGAHFALVPVGAYLATRIWRRRKPVSAALPSDYSDRLTRLEQSVDAVAIEVERIGEGQRFMTRLFTEPRSRQAAAQALDMDAPEAAEHVTPH